MKIAKIDLQKSLSPLIACGSGDDSFMEVEALTKESS